MPNTSQELWGQTPAVPAPPTHQVPCCRGGQQGAPSRHRELSGDAWAGVGDTCKLFSPSTPQRSHSPPLSSAQLSQQGQEEKTSYQLISGEGWAVGLLPSAIPGLMLFTL